MKTNGLKTHKASKLKFCIQPARANIAPLFEAWIRSKQVMLHTALVSYKFKAH